MRQPEIILTVAGSDSSGGAGIQADIKTISALGGYAASVITAVTAQNTKGVQAVYPLPANLIKAQLEAVLEDLRPGSVKIGMVYDPAAIDTIAGALERYKPAHVVYDPVMVSTSGRKLMEDTAIEHIQELLFPRCTLVTPNLHEASLLAGQTLKDTASMSKFGQWFASRHQTNVLVKGGHLEGGLVQDILCQKDGKIREYDGQKVETPNLHGTGCTLSSAIATFLAKGYTLEKAVEEAKTYITHAIEEARDWHIGHGNGPLCHFF